jgi:hypothetical protein
MERINPPDTNNPDYKTGYNDAMDSIILATEKVSKEWEPMDFNSRTFYSQGVVFGLKIAAALAEHINPGMSEEEFQAVVANWQNLIK